MTLGVNSVALSGEQPTPLLCAEFQGVGLLRSEYVFRDLEMYPTEADAQGYLARYLENVCSAFPAYVNYRTMEVTSGEANVLRGVEQILSDGENALMGLRGVRRHMRFPSSLDAELQVIANVSSAYDNLRIVCPFVSSAEEFAWYKKRVRRIAGPDIAVGAMIEVPSAVLTISNFLKNGVDFAVVGSNDLSSFLAASVRDKRRPTALVPGFAEALELVAAACNGANVDAFLAGYLTQPLIEAAEAAGIERFVGHYSDLPRLFADDERWETLPELSHLRRVKGKTEAAISVRNVTALSGQGGLS